MATTSTVGRITVKYIEGSDTIAGSRQTINDNFQTLADGINTIEQYVNTDSKTISGIESLTIQKGIGSITDNLISTNGSVSAGGNVVANASVVGNIGRFKTGLTIESGNVNIEGTDSVLALAGDLRLGGEVTYEGFGNTFLNAADKLSFTTNNWTNLVYDGSGVTMIGGLISVGGISALIIDWSQWISVNDSRYFLDAIKLSTTDIRNGHQLRIMVQVGNIIGHNFTLMADTLATYQELTTGVQFNKNYQFIDLIFDGTNWVIISFSPGVTLV
jgi:hypothetical protein